MATILDELKLNKITAFWASSKALTTLIFAAKKHYVSVGIAVSAGDVNCHTKPVICGFG